MSFQVYPISSLPLDQYYTTVACLDREAPNHTKARIHLVRQNATSLLCIRKRMAQLTSPLQWREEIEILRKISHPFICAYVDAYITDGFPPSACLYMEYCELGDLHDLIDSYASRQDQYGQIRGVPEAFAWNVLLQMAQALCYIHQGLVGWNAINDAAMSRMGAGVNGWMQVIHRDIKPANIFLQTPRPDRGGSLYPVPKLGDFGLAIKEDHPGFRPPREHTGTPGWLPPEFPNFGQRGDVWALGAIVECLCSPNRSPEGRIDEIISDGEWREREQFAAGNAYSREMNEAVRMATTGDKTRRPYARELAASAWTLFERARPLYEPLPQWALSQPR